MTANTTQKIIGFVAFFIPAVLVPATIALTQIVSPSYDSAPQKTVSPQPLQPEPLQQPAVPAGAVAPATPWHAAPPQGLSREEMVVNNATAVFQEFMAMPTRRIPGRILRDAQAIAIIPNVIKGGFIVGIRHGTGVLLPRSANGGFGAPRFISLTGGSVGFQAGVQSTDVVLVFRTARSVQNLMQGTFTLGVDAAAAAGPVGRQASAATNAQLNAEVWSYSRSRGAFVGVSLDGSAIQVDSYADQLYYHATPGMATAWPPSAHRLVSLLDGYLGATATAGAVVPTAAVATTPAPASTTSRVASVPSQEKLRGQLAATAPHLYAALPDEKWRNYLALPKSVYFENQPVDTVGLQSALAHFDAVARAPEYHLLASEPVFQEVYGLLKRYTTSATAAGLSLPPPPPHTPPPAPSAATAPLVVPKR